MTITEFRKIIKGLPGQMDLAIEIDGDTIEPVCGITDVMQVQFNDTKEKRFVLVIKPCRCEQEQEEMALARLN